MNRLVRKGLGFAINRAAAVKPLVERAFAAEARTASWWASKAHERLMEVQWGFPPQPEHFDHHIDLFYQWLKTRNSLWVERGVFGSFVLRGGDLLELCCGDGFGARNFYSLRSRRVVSCDFDPAALKTAKAKNSAPNIEYLLADIRTSMPEGKFENIIWDAAIEHFTEAEMLQIFDNIKLRLLPGGILSGYTLVEQPGGKSLSHHEYEFKSKEDLLRLIKPHFANVKIFETIYPERHNLYFWASDGPLPFGDGWPHTISA
jgi:SAM-dependent methyltransferase